MTEPRYDYRHLGGQGVSSRCASDRGKGEEDAQKSLLMAGCHVALSSNVVVPMLIEPVNLLHAQ